MNVIDYIIHVLYTDCDTSPVALQALARGSALVKSEMKLSRGSRGYQAKHEMVMRSVCVHHP